MSIISLFEHKTPTEIGELLSYDFNDFVKRKIKETIDELLEGEIEALFNEAFRAANGDFRNGYYYRHLKTHYGLIEVKVPRDRLNLFKTQIMKPYRQVTDDVDYVVQSLYFKGLSQNDLVDYVTNSMHVELSRETVGNIVKKLMHTAEVFRTRPLPRCSVIYLDGTYVPLKRKYADGRAYVEKECIEVAIGITETGRREVLGFYPVPNEGADSWEVSLNDLKSRGVGSPKLFITDGLNGLDMAIKSIFPDSKHQRCVVHIQRNIMVGVRYNDRKEICSDFKEVYTRDTYQQAMDQLDLFIDKWSPSYPKVCRAILETPDMFTFYDFPKPSHQYIRTSNAIESFNSVLKRHSRRRILFNGEDNASLVIVQIAAKYNSDWKNRIVDFIKDLNEEERNKFGLCII